MVGRSVIRPATWEGKIIPGDKLKITHQHMTPYYTVKKETYSEVWLYAGISAKEKVNRQLNIFRSDFRKLNDPFEYAELELWHRRVVEEYSKLKKGKA